MAFEKLKDSAKTITADEGVVNYTPPSFDATTLKAKVKPKGKLVNPVPGFGSAPKKKKG
jgi:hypothetical protein